MRNKLLGNASSTRAGRTYLHNLEPVAGYQIRLTRFHCIHDPGGAIAKLALTDRVHMCFREGDGRTDHDPNTAATAYSSGAEEISEQARAYAGTGGFSAYVAEALEQRVAMDKLRELVTDFEKDNEPLTREEIDAAREEMGFERRRRTRPVV